MDCTKNGVKRVTRWTMSFRVVFSFKVTALDKKVSAYKEQVSSCNVTIIISACKCNVMKKYKH